MFGKDLVFERFEITDMTTCKKSTEWTIKKEHGKLPFHQKLQLLSHLAICRACRLFARHSIFLTKAFREANSTLSAHLTADEKKALFHSVKEKLKE